MGRDVLDVLDELAARGRRLRAQMPGDYKPIELADSVSGALAEVYAPFWSGPGADLWRIGRKMGTDDPAQEP